MRLRGDHPFGQESNIVAANVSHTGDGPTSFTVFDLLSESYTKTLRVNFESGSNGYAAMYEQTINPGYSGPNYATHHAKFTSFAGVTKGTVNPCASSPYESLKERIVVNRSTGAARRGAALAYGRKPRPFT